MIHILIAALVLVAVVFIYRESSGYNIVKYELTTDKDISPVRFVMLSDLHDTDVTRDHNKGLIESIASLEPDFVVLAGDMITSYLQPRLESDTAYDFLRMLSERFTVYYGLGNHEQRYKAEPQKFAGKFDDLISYASGLGIKVLSDSFIDTDDNNIRIYGFDIPIENYKRGVTLKLPDDILGQTFQEVDRERYNILIAHTPDFFADYAKWGPDLVLSGHLHGGIIGVPGIGGIISPQLRLFPKYDFGRYEKDDTTMIVSRGIGWHSVPIRIFNKAEIVMITINNRGDMDGNQRKA